MNWVVTGYSGKSDGFLFVVEADDGAAACKKVAELNNCFFKQIEYGDPCNGGGVADIMYPQHYGDNTSMFEKCYEMGDGPLRCWEMYYEPVTFNHNLSGAVCW
jgi:hypothetical protein